jgi:HEPN domain-containing protein
MLPTTREWVRKAESDRDVVLLLLRSRKRSRQQCVEKYMKVRLTEAGIAFPKTHDLTLLLNLALAVEPGWAKVSRELIALTYWAILPRYPGTTAASGDARAAVSTCRRLRRMARRAFGLKS